MKKLSLFSVLFLSSQLNAYQIQSVKVVGDKAAEIQFVGNGNIPIPTYKVSEGVLELSFVGAQMSEANQGKLDLEAPHALIRRISVYSPEKDLVRARIVINGSSDNLKQRFNLARAENGISATLEYPQGDSATLSLLKEEQMPIANITTEGKKEARFPYLQTVLILFLLLTAGGTTFFFVKVLKKKGGLRGSRRHLIEQMGYISLGAKTGVSLIKVGREFVLVGITPTQINFLSNLPKLQEQYDEETHFERGVFREAMNEEVERIRTTNA